MEREEAKMIIKSINLMALATIPLSIWLGCTGRVSWELLVLIWLMECNFDLRRK